MHNHLEPYRSRRMLVPQKTEGVVVCEESYSIYSDHVLKHDKNNRKFINFTKKIKMPIKST